MITLSVRRELALTYCRRAIGSSDISWAHDVAASMDRLPPKAAIMGKWRCKEHFPRDHIRGLLDGMLASAAAGCSSSAPASSHVTTASTRAAGRVPGRGSSAAAPPMRVTLHTTKFDQINLRSGTGEWVRSDSHSTANRI